MTDRKNVVEFALVNALRCCFWPLVIFGNSPLTVTAATQAEINAYIPLRTIGGAVYDFSPVIRQKLENPTLPCPYYLQGRNVSRTANVLEIEVSYYSAPSRFSPSLFPGSQQVLLPPTVSTITENVRNVPSDSQWERNHDLFAWPLGGGNFDYGTPFKGSLAGVTVYQVTEKGLVAFRYATEQEIGANRTDLQDSALAWNRSQADEGDAYGELRMGERYRDGEGVEKDISKAREWLAKAVAQGDAQAAKDLDRMNAVPSILTNAPSAIATTPALDDPLFSAANSGSAEAQFKLGSNYWFQAKNYTEAIKWWIRAADQGNVNAQLSLADSYDRGDGVSQDHTEAVKWWRKAAENGDAHGQYWLGASYHEGKGLTKDYTEAAKWYRTAADQGLPDAEFELGSCYFDGEGVAKDYAQAVIWFRKAADQGLAAAQYDLATCYDHGRGVQQDYAEAAGWWRKAAIQGFTAAQFNLGSCYENGEGVVKDYGQAVLWYRKAGENGDASAQFNLAACYINGNGVVRDYVTADAWLNLSAAQGHEIARQNLPELEQRMSQTDVAEGHRLAREFQARHTAH